ncbi:MAG: hypothetical protein IKA42_04210, partial [Clostridia bacterium]|nr:hypothetical protein [Clostridia bacterium]
ILIGLLTFSGTVFLGIITLYQNYIFKTYAEDNDKKQREQDLIIRTTPSLQLKTIDSMSFDLDSDSDFKHEEVLREKDSMSKNTSSVKIRFVFDGKTDFLSKINIYNIEIETYNCNEESCPIIDKYSFWKSSSKTSSIILKEHDICSVEICLLFDERARLERLLKIMKEFSTDLLVSFRVENLFGVTYAKVARILLDTNDTCFGEGDVYGFVRLDKPIIRDQEIIHSPHVE